MTSDGLLYVAGRPMSRKRGGRKEEWRGGYGFLSVISGEMEIFRSIDSAL
jgi:hypothetical protein